MADGVELVGLSQQTIIKEPGSIAGESVTLKDLEGCEVYILDFSSLVEVSNCTSCKIFIGPVDGSAIFSGVSNSTLAVASQRFQVKGSQNLDIGLYCATKPEVEQSSDIRISCWMGAYPGLSGHFQSANLDPKANQWDKALDVDGDNAFGPSFQLVEAVEYWEPAVAGNGPPENPVPAPDGTLYVAPAHANGNPPAENGILNLSGSSGAATLGNTGPLSAGSGTGLFTPGSTGGPYSGPAPVEGDHPKVAAMKDKMQQRLAHQESDEQSAKQQLAEKANKHLEEFYQRRQAQVAQRSKDNRTSSGAGGQAGHNLEGSTPWEKTLNLINFNFQRASAADKARFKTVLFSAKANNTAAPPRAS